LYLAGLKAGMPMPENSDFYPQVMQRYVSEPSLPGNQMEFISTLIRVFEEKIFSAADFESYPIEIIVDYIQRTHIFYFEKKLPEIEQSIGLLSDHYESHHPILTALRNFFLRYVNDLSEHIRAEENLLLPYITTLRAARKTPAHFSTFVVARRDYSIDRFLNDHHDTEDELKDIRQTIRLYDPPQTNESLYRILLSQLQTFEQDLRVHAHIEEEVLIPKALAIEKDLNAQLLYLSPFN
jgi:regulator of cell morphogenesis and NO signaling